MRGPRETIDAAMLAAAIRVDRLAERNVRRSVAGADRSCRIAQHLGAQWRRLLIIPVPAVVEADAPFRVIAAGIVRPGASSFEEPWISRSIEYSGHGRSLIQHKNKSRTIEVIDIDQTVQPRFMYD